MSIADGEYLAVLQERAAYLQGRIAAKQAVPTRDGLGWDTVYDERERAALLWAIENLRKEPPC